MRKALHTLLDYLPSIIVVATVIYLTCFPDPLHSARLPIFPHADKLVHAIMFGGVVAAFDFDYMRSRRTLTSNAKLTILLSAILFGAATELVQHFADISRSGDLLDFIADCIGIMIAYVSAPPVIARIFGIKDFQ